MPWQLSIAYSIVTVSKVLLLFFSALGPSAILVLAVASLVPPPLTGQKLGASEVARGAALASPISVHAKTAATHSPVQERFPVSGRAAEDETIEALLLASESPPLAAAGTADQTEVEAEGAAHTLNSHDEPRPLKSEPMATSSVNSATGSGAQPNIQASDGAPHPQLKPAALGPDNQRGTPDRASERNYGGRVWAALARNKLKPDRRGSATVNFAIEASGQLGHVRVSESSGSEGLDQMALNTVRNSAPFPPPPNGRTSYTIRIDFQ